MADCIALADEVAERLSAALSTIPADFFGSFAYTKTGNNLTHPIACGLLSRVVWEVPGVDFVGMDVRLNLGRRVKFQPDLVAYGPQWSYVLFVDYESPNSSDTRIPVKDVDAYREWSDRARLDVPYLIITTLPDRPCPTWELRWTSDGYGNARFRGQLGNVRENPFRFWYSFYEKEFRSRDMTGVALINIDGTHARRAFPQTGS